MKQHKVVSSVMIHPGLLELLTLEYKTINNQILGAVSRSVAMIKLKWNHSSAFLSQTPKK
jgi:hypothetical protein